MATSSISERRMSHMFAQTIRFAALLGLAWSLAESDKGRRHYVFLAILLDN